LGEVLHKNYTKIYDCSGERGGGGGGVQGGGGVGLSAVALAVAIILSCEQNGSGVGVGKEHAICCSESLEGIGWGSHWGGPQSPFVTGDPRGHVRRHAA